MLPFACPLVSLAPVLAAGLLDRVPGILFGLPMLVVASLVFAATHHENPAAIRRAAIEWILWISGVLGAVLAVVIILGWLA